MHNLIEKNDWEIYYSTNKAFNVATEKDSIRKFIDTYATPLKTDGSIETCIEIGCFPGRYLGYFAEKGYKVSGVDYVEDVTKMKNWMKECGYCIDHIYKEDFTQLNIKKSMM